MRLLGRIGWSLPLLAGILGCSTLTFAAQSFTAKVPLVFEPNRGQAPADIRYLLRGSALEGEFQRDGVRLKLLGRTKNVSQVKMRLLGTREDAVISGGGALQGYTNYLMGDDAAHWLRGLPNSTELRYSQIYPGTDLVFYGKDGSLEHDFEVQPGGDPNRIAFRLDGAENLTLGKNGDLQIGLVDGAITFERPIAYQTVAGERRNVNAAFSVDKDGTVHFRLGSYDRARELVIDPVLTFSTYLSPLASDANLIAADASGNNYVAGYATLGFPVTANAFAGCTNCTANTTVTFISKLSADGTSLIYSTVLGGNSFAQPTGIAVDGNGNVLVSGWTGATNFPTKNGQPIAPPDNAYLGFLVSLSADGSSLNYGTMLGSPPSVSPAATTYATAVAVDSSGNAYVTGDTGDGFFTTPGALDQEAVTGSRNSSDVFLAKFSPTGTLVYSAVLGTADPQNGGGGPIGVSAIAVDASGDAFVAGQAGTVWPISSDAYLNQIGGSMPYADPFVTEVAPDAKSVVYSTYLDYAYVVTGIAALSNGNVFVAGNDAGSSYPTTASAYESNSGDEPSFLTELNSSGSGLVYSTAIGDSTYKVYGLALDTDGDIWLAAQTSNPQFPVVAPIQGTFPTSGPASLVNEFDPTGQTLMFSTFLGGSAPGYANSVAVDANDKVHIAGAAGYGMYTTPGVYAGSVPTPGSGYGESAYAYVALIDPTAASGTLCLGGSAAQGLSFGYLFPQATESQNVQATNCGSGPLTINSIASSNAAFTVPASSNGCTGSLTVGASCTVGVEFEPAAAQAYSGQLTFTSNASIATTSIPLSGSGGEPAAGFRQTLSFSPLLVGQTSPAEIIPLYNNGPLPLTIYLSQITVTSGFALAPGGTCTSSLPAYQYCLISVEFAPTTAGTINGTLSVSSNDPVNPTISTSLTGIAYTSYPIATITALFNPSDPIGGTSPITMNVEGSNFFPASVVYINGAPQATTYESAGGLSVTFASSLLNAVGQFPVTVVNPSPGGGSSAPYPLIGYLSIPLTASALTIDPVGGLLYAAIPATASQNPNTVIPINPATGVAMTPIAVASGPRVLAVSDDGTELYVASTGILQRFNLQTLALERTFNLPVDPEWGQTYVQEMHVVPGSPQSIVVELFANVDPAEDGAALYNDSGLVNWLPGEAPVSNPLQMDSFAFTSSSSIYALPAGNTFFTNVQVSPTGLSYGGGGGGAGGITEQTGSILRSDGTLLYTNSGEVWNPATQKLLGTYLEANGDPLFYTPGVVPDTSNGQTDFLDEDAQYIDYQALTIDVYDQASFGLLGTVPFTSIYPPDATDLVRWGSNGFAFRCVDTIGSGANQIVIVTSNLVSQNSVTPIPIVSSVSPATVYSGGPAFTLQVTGSGFTSASTVLINGNSRTTTYVSGTSLTAQVLASDIVQNGQLNVQVTTPAPGGGTSNGAAVLIEAAPRTTPTVTVTPSAASITTAQALTVSVAVSGASGSPTPTGSVVLSGGGYTSAAVTLSGGSASINIPAGLLATGSDTLTATYSPDANSSSSYNSAYGSNIVTVSRITPPVTVTPSSSSISTTQMLSVTVTVGGTPTPTGAITLSSGTYTSGATTLTNGGATINIAAGSLIAGTDTLTASYTPDSGSSATYNSASGSSIVTVTTPAKTTPAVTVIPLPSSITTTQALSVTVTVAGTPTPTGTAILSGGGYISSATTLTSGSATINVPAGALSIGTDTLTASYTPDSSSSATYNSASGTGSVSVNKATPTVTAWPTASAITAGQTLASSTLSGGIASVGGTFAWTTPTAAPGVGNYSESVTFTPTDTTDYNTVTGTVMVTVNAAPSFTLSPSPVSISVAQGGSGSSTISVTNVGGFSGSVALSATGLPTGVTSSFAAGSAAGTEVLTLMASTSAQVTSTPVTVTVTGTSGALSATASISLSITQEPSFTAGSGGTTSISIAPGATTGNTGTISIAGTNGFAGTVSLTCSVTTSMTNVSDMPSCSLNPASVAISGAIAETSTLTVSTTPASSAENRIEKLIWPTGRAALALILLFMVPRRRRSWSAMLGMILLCAAIGAVGCGGGSGGSGGGGGGNSGTTAGNYTVTVTGTSGSVSATVGTVIVTVQ